MNKVSQKGGRLRLFVNKWKEITDDKFVLNCIKGYKIPVDCLALEDLRLKTDITFTDGNSNGSHHDISKAVETLLSKGAIVECNPCEDQFLSPYFLIDKPDGSHRFILNLKRFNKVVYKEHFKMENLNTVVGLTFPSYFLGKIDLEDAYLFISVHKESRKFLRFYFNNTLYEFVCLPFGLCSAPFVFTKVMKVIIKNLRNLGFSSVIYLDDMLCIEKTFEKCSENVNKTVMLLEELGFIINYKKSQTIPSNNCKFLGFIIDTIKYSIELTQEKREKIFKIIERFLKIDSCTIQEFAQLIGKLIACCPALEYGWLYTKSLEQEKIFQLIINEYNYNKVMKIPTRVKKDLEWWKSNILTGIHFIKDNNFAKIIHSDASLSGWGATDGEKKIQGFWSTEHKKLHINYLELLAIQLALERLAADCYDVQLLLRIDNITAASYINRMGGVRLPRYANLAKRIWQWAENKKINLVASYIPSKDNVIADTLSRIKNKDTEWELNDIYFNKIIKKWGNPQIDLFASFLNNKCEKYVSWKQESKAMFIDAFTVNWSNLFFYAFPPFSMVLKTLRKIKSENACGIIVVPSWKNQPWFPLFEELIIDEPIIFRPNSNLLLSPCRTIRHPQSIHLTLIAGLVSGKRS